MKRVLACTFIFVYLTVLSGGIASHAVNYGTGASPLMYFVIWDMFCGWTAWDSRLHIIAEGESRKYYELAPAPWGALHPWGKLGRENYDVHNNHTARIGLNTLRHTSHEPMTRLFVIEENWPKKFNLPDNVWNLRYDQPKNVVKYHQVRLVLYPDGTVAQSYGPWSGQMAGKMFLDNPRLQEQASRARSTFMVQPERPGQDMMLGPGTVPGSGQSSSVGVGAPLGN
jgi:hypothetical protein